MTARRDGNEQSQEANMKHKDIILACKCKSEFQDKAYGKGRRAGTPVNKSRSKPNNELTEARCTVCETTHRVA